MKSQSHQLTSFRAYLCDKSYFIILLIFAAILSTMILKLFKVVPEVIIVLLLMWFVIAGICLVVGYLRKKDFYRGLLDTIDRLDQAYLILETLEEPKSYDGEIIYQALYGVNKSMHENVMKFRMQTQEFQEYVEMWIHEVKTPLATLALISRDPKVNEQIKRLDDYVEQILYFARAENAERDYLIKPVKLADLVGNVASRNREILQAKRINFVAKDLDLLVQTDSKWMEFILNQILNNSIKYQSSEITVVAERVGHDVKLMICDNGIGITQSDLPRVFDKSFTGNNGRLGKRSTGMGLYIAKTLCNKLGHQIEIQSEEGKFTKVIITFADSQYYKVIDSSS